MTEIAFNDIGLFYLYLNIYVVHYLQLYCDFPDDEHLFELVVICSTGDNYLSLFKIMDK